MRRSVSPARARIGLVALWLFGGCAVPSHPGSQGSGAGRGDAGADAMLTDPACASVKCEPLECGSGLLAMPLPGECCPTICVPDDCSTVDCPPLACPAGTHEAASRGSCCKHCVTDSAGSGTCEEGQTGYATFLNQLLGSAEVSACSQDSDCRLVSLDNSCGASCGTPVSGRGAATLTTSANAYADAHCAACTAPTPCPPVERFAICLSGACSAY
jgi:hypothetical protein